MRHDLDRAALAQGQPRAPRRLARLALAALPLTLIGCGGGTTTVTVTPAPPSSSATAPPTTTSTATSSTASATPAPGPVISLVWVVATPTGAQIRQVRPGAGPVRTIATLAPDDHVVAHGSGLIVVATATRWFRIITVSDGSSRLPAGGFGGVFLDGAALSPDGTKLAYVDSVGGLSGALKVIDLGTGSSTTLRTFPNNRLDVPATWSDTGIGATNIVGASDAPPQAALTLNPATGARVASTVIANLAAIVLTADAAHAALILHSALGDEADFAGGPGPQGPFNTLQLATIGGGVVTLLKEAHHDITALASLPSGDRVLVHDGSAAGGFAGISLSPDFGLIAVGGGGAKAQYAKEDGTQYDSGAFYQDGTTVAVSSHSSSGERLVQYAPGAAPVTLDSVAGGQFASVFLV
ncbi:MAG TPA: hypothetical protein VI316_02540 [Candidatus Dormibacteraeota bacterium]